MSATERDPESSSAKRKLVVTLASNANSDRSTIAFTIANACLSAGMDVMVFLLSDGAELARDSASHLAHVRPFRPLHELLESFIRDGGTLAACGSCVQYRGMEAEHVPEGLQIAGVALLARWLADGAQTISL